MLIKNRYRRFADVTGGAPTCVTLDGQTCDVGQSDPAVAGKTVAAAQAVGAAVESYGAPAAITVGSPSLLQRPLDWVQANLGGGAAGAVVALSVVGVGLPIARSSKKSYRRSLPA